MTFVAAAKWPTALDAHPESTMIVLIASRQDAKQVTHAEAEDRPRRFHQDAEIERRKRREHPAKRQDSRDGRRRGLGADQRDLIRETAP